MGGLLLRITVSLYRYFRDCTCTGELTILVPVVHGLETVHHRTVETVGCRDQNNRHEKPIELSQARLLIPCDFRKRPATKNITRILCRRNCSSSTHFVFRGENSYKEGIAEFWALSGVARLWCSWGGGRWLMFSEGIHGPEESIEAGIYT